ncbi:hypothetical protein [Marinimicrobium sp. ABcell2]|nr:hypothetical protein [Marinimicrobium sp. ABcell2]MDQ2075308.1 hypothetical protein [Marinimicrobium sp. ABcell2]
MKIGSEIPDADKEQSATDLFGAGPKRQYKAVVFSTQVGKFNKAQRMYP